MGSGTLTLPSKRAVRRPSPCSTKKNALLRCIIVEDNRGHTSPSSSSSLSSSSSSCSSSSSYSHHIFRQPTSSRNEGQHAYLKKLFVILVTLFIYIFKVLGLRWEWWIHYLQLTPSRWFKRLLHTVVYSTRDFAENYFCIII